MNNNQPSENEITLSLIETYCDTCKATACAGCPVFEIRGTPSRANYKPCPSCGVNFHFKTSHVMIVDKGEE